jgi:hypothetical protein|tara:strand:- start:5582 stop:6217 length:636 start_codon:yes stop_codon:yes gene_type:complete
MAGCNITKGRGYFCGGQVGGIKRIFLANFYGSEAIWNVVTATTDTTDPFGYVTEVWCGDQWSYEKTGQQDFYEFDLDRQMSSFNQTILTGKGGAIAYQTELELHLSHDSTESWMRMQNVVEGLWQVIIEDNNGVFYLAGVENGIEVSGGSYAHGGDVAYGDYVGYVVSMIGAEPLPAYNLGTETPFGSARWDVADTGQLALTETQYNTPQV